MLLTFTLDFCPDMDREAVRAIGRTDASPSMESTDSHWATIAAWTEDAADLGDAEDLGDGDGALSDDEDEGDGRWWLVRCDPRSGLFLRLRSGLGGASCPLVASSNGATRYAASRHTTR